MKLLICAGPATTGKTSVLRHMISRLIDRAHRPAFLKIDVQYAEEDQQFAEEFHIPSRKVYSGELCPDHCTVMVLGDAIAWAAGLERDLLLVETAGLCLRCSPYVDAGMGIIVLEATSGTNLPLKVGPMLSLADTAVVTKIDRVSQAEREVFRARIGEVAPGVRVREADALRGIGIDPLVEQLLAQEDLPLDAASRPRGVQLRGNPPVGTCTICVGKREVGWQAHFGVVRSLQDQVFYRGE